MSDPFNISAAKRIREISWDYQEVVTEVGHRKQSSEAEVNEAISLGWKLLKVEKLKEELVYVLGWFGDAEPAQTTLQVIISENRKRSAEAEARYQREEEKRKMEEAKAQAEFDALPEDEKSRRREETSRMFADLKKSLGIPEKHL